MHCHDELPLEIVIGLPFSASLQWQSTDRAYRDISAATKAAPCVITAAAHGLPPGWPYAIAGARGLTQINRGNLTDDRDLYDAKVLNSETLEINELNSSALTEYTGGGVIEYFIPESLAGYTEAEAQFRRALTDTQPFATLTKTAGDIVLDDAAKLITLQLDATETAALVAQAGLDGIWNLVFTTAAGVKVEVVPNSPLRLVLSATR